jgi:hypothetical protein
MKWLEAKRDQVLGEAKMKYWDIRKDMEKQAIELSGLPQLREEIEAHLDAALKLWLVWRDKHKDDNGVSFSDKTWGFPFESTISMFAASAGDTQKSLLAHSVSFKTDMMERLEQDHNATMKLIFDNYCNVLTVADSLQNAKAVKAYLESLGFDLDELIPKKPEVTALAVPVNPAFLFLKTAAA